MSYLDLKKLPRKLQATLDKHFDNDESKRRAALAPWCAAVCSSVWPRGTWPWSLSAYWWRPRVARLIREQTETFFTMHVGDLSNLPSLFDPHLPFFPTPLTNVTKPMVSPWPDVLSDAEYWAFVMQLHDGDEAWARNRLGGWIPQMREAVHPHGTKRLFFWRSKSAILSDLNWRMSAQNVGDYT
ncbi:MAG: hypothetical protein JF606_10000 [Burkholderiales bacterium]|jgi:hypothetical protein|nr:hypothetical protein [Burkholderiales bacterium]